MTRDFKTAMLVLSFGLPLFLLAFIAALYFGNCGFGAQCAYNNLPAIIHTPIPTLIPASMPTAESGGQAPASIKCPVAAATLLNAWVTAGYPEAEAFDFTDLNGVACQGTFTDIQFLFGESNLWYPGALACISCHNETLNAASAQLDMSGYNGILAGSRRSSPEVQGQDILGGGVWEQSMLNDMLFVQKKMPFGRPPDAVPDQGPVVLAGEPTTDR